MSPSACCRYSLIIYSFYIVGLTLVGLLISLKDECLLNSANLYRDGTSPFVLVGKDALLKGFDDFMNLVICVSVISIGVSAVFGGSRTLTVIAYEGYAPGIFAYVDKSGRPLMLVLLYLAFGSLAFLGLASTGFLVFQWLLSISGLSVLIVWGSICIVSTPSVRLKRWFDTSLLSAISDSERLGCTMVAR